MQIISSVRFSPTKLSLIPTANTASPDALSSESDNFAGMIFLKTIPINPPIIIANEFTIVPSMIVSLKKFQ